MLSSVIVTNAESGAPPSFPIYIFVKGQKVRFRNPKPFPGNTFSPGSRVFTVEDIPRDLWKEQNFPKQWIKVDGYPHSIAGDYLEPAGLTFKVLIEKSYESGAKSGAVLGDFGSLTRAIASARVVRGNASAMWVEDDKGISTPLFWTH